MLRTLVVTLIPSPYQVELFNWLRHSSEVACTVAYLHKMAADRNWSVQPIEHEAVILEETPNSENVLGTLASTADLLVISNYSHPAVRALMRSRQREGRAWCFWGERPGFRRLGLLGAIYRRWRLADLHRSRAAIWGMGKWAVDGWRSEFGDGRSYFNVPYASNLERFRPTGQRSVGARRRFLFSGALVHRKGIDLLIAAFARLAARERGIELRVLGTGPLATGLARRCAALGDRIRFVGFRDWPVLPLEYHEADVLCVPSRYDGWGMVVPEGLAAGLPTIATDRMGAALELIAPGVNGWRIPAGCEEPLYQALSEAASLSARELGLRSAAAQASVAEYSLGAGGRRWLAAAAESVKCIEPNRQ